MLYLSLPLHPSSDPQEELNRWVSEVAQPPPLPCLAEELRTLVAVEFNGFDLGFSAVAVGLNPVYDSLATGRNGPKEP